MPILVIWLDQRMSKPPYWNHWLHDIMQLMVFCVAKSLKRCATVHITVDHERGFQRNVNAYSSGT
jgi:hypothetical protein